MRTVLTIAGSDCSGGAGIQADIKTITAHGLYASSAITALTAQNTLGVTGIVDVDPGFVGQQIDAVVTDIRPDAVKIGMVSNAATIAVIAGKLREYGLACTVADPVMVSTSGHLLLDPDAAAALRTELLPLARVITPNLAEAAVLAGGVVESRVQMEEAAASLASELGTAVLIKGGHLDSSASDVLFDDGEVRWFEGVRVDTGNTHGTGCTLSSALACNLAAGLPLAEAVASAKDYLAGALADGMDLGGGSGPVNHVYRL